MFCDGNNIPVFSIVLPIIDIMILILILALVLFLTLVLFVFSLLIFIFSPFTWSCQSGFSLTFDLVTAFVHDPLAVCDCCYSNTSILFTLDLQHLVIFSSSCHRFSLCLTLTEYFVPSFVFFFLLENTNYTTFYYYIRCTR